MTYTKNFLKLLFVVGLLLLLTQAVRADVGATAINFKESNQDVDHFTLNDGHFDPNYDSDRDIALRETGAIPLYQVFNLFFKEDLFASGEDLINTYRTRGEEFFRVTNEWVATEGAKIHSVYQCLAEDLLVVFEFDTGEKKFPFPASQSGSANGWISEEDAKAVWNLTVGSFSIYLSQPGTAGGSIVRPESSGDWSERFPFSEGIDWGPDGMIHMIAFNVTDLMNDDTIESAWLFAWEAFHAEFNRADYGYYNLVQILINVKPAQIDLSPEPATALILLSGMAAYPLVRRFRKK